MFIPNPPLKIGLIVDSERASKYLYDIAEWSQSQDNLFISHLIIQNKIPIQQEIFKRSLRLLKDQGLLHFLSKLSFFIITKLEHLVLLGARKYEDHLRLYDLTKIVPQSIKLEPIISQSGFIYRYPEEAIRNIRSLDLDLLIRGGSGILRGDILRSAKFGILSFHHGNNRLFRGGPAGFWEVYFQQAQTGFIIQQLTEELDGGHVLRRGQFPTKFFYLLNQASLFRKSNFYLKQLLSEIATTRSLPPIEETQPYFNRLFKTPNLYHQLVYVVTVFLSVVHKVFRLHVRKTYDSWGVSFSRTDWKTLVMWRAYKIKNPPNHYLADPFLFHEEGRDYCFVEDYHFKERKGCISVYEINENNSERLGEVLREPFHLSFPFLFRYQSKIYMCPETRENKDIRLYECARFPLQWRLSRIVMKDVYASDTLIFEHDGIWWLITNIDPMGGEIGCSDLCIFFSDKPISDKWEPHPRNPICIDSSKGRNGGILYHDKSIYRVSQKQGFDMYGKGFSINKILLLTKEHYLEAEVCSIEPNFYPNIKGTHHLHSIGNLSAFDYVREVRVKQ